MAIKLAMHFLHHDPGGQLRPGASSWVSAPSWACPRSWTAPWACPWPSPLSWSWPPPPPGPSTPSWRPTAWTVSADHRLHPGHRHPGAAGGEHPEEVHPRPVQGSGRVSAPDHHQLHHAGRDHAELDNGYDFPESIVCAAGAGVGFLVAMVLFSGVRRKVEEADLPSALRACPSPWWPPR